MSDTKSFLTFRSTDQNVKNKHFLYEALDLFETSLRFRPQETNLPLKFATVHRELSNMRLAIEWLKREILTRGEIKKRTLNILVGSSYLL